jgi:hypothetical protein
MILRAMGFAVAMAFATGCGATDERPPVSDNTGFAAGSMPAQGSGGAGGPAEPTNGGAVGSDRAIDDDARIVQGPTERQRSVGTGVGTGGGISGAAGLGASGVGSGTGNFQATNAALPGNGMTGVGTGTSPATMRPSDAGGVVGEAGGGGIVIVVGP